MSDSLRQKIQSQLEVSVRDVLLSDIQCGRLTEALADDISELFGDMPADYDDKVYEVHPFDALFNDTTNAVVEAVIGGAVQATAKAAQVILDAIQEVDVLRYDALAAEPEHVKESPQDAVTRIGDFHVVCTCCGQTFEAAQWARLSDLGVQNYSDGIALELRNCPCGSTISSTLVDRYGHLAADLKELEETRS